MLRMSKNKKFNRKMSKKKIKSKYNIKKEYKEAFKFLWSVKNYFIFVVLLFFLITIAVYSGAQNQELNNTLLEYLKKVAEKFEGKGIIETIFLIFSNNLFVSFLAIVTGVFFGIMPLIFIISNGYALGFIAQKTVDIAGITILWKLFPHGIFELPAVFISLALGLKLGTFVFANKPWKTLWDYFYKSMRVFFYVVFPLLVIAAIIEGSLIVLLK